MIARWSTNKVNDGQILVSAAALCNFASSLVLSRVPQARGGDLLWETAGRGFVHDGVMVPDESVKEASFAQVWVNLPSTLFPLGSATCSISRSVLLPQRRAKAFSRASVC